MAAIGKSNNLGSKTRPVGFGLIVRTGLIELGATSVRRCVDDLSASSIQEILGQAREHIRGAKIDEDLDAFADGRGNGCRPVIALNKDCARDALGLGVVDAVASLGQGPCPRSNLRDGLFEHVRVEGSCNGEEFENCLEGSTALEVFFQSAVFGGNARLKRVSESLKIVGAARKNDGARAVDDRKRNRLGIHGLGNHRAGEPAYGQHRGGIPKLRSAEANAQRLCSGADEDGEGKNVGDALVIAGNPRACNFGAQDALGVAQEHGRARVNVELGCVKVSKRSELREGNPGN